MKNFCTLMICLMLNVINTIGIDYRIGNFEEKSGLYFEDMGVISVYTKSFRILWCLDLNYILNVDAKLRYDCPNRNESSSMCTTFDSIPEKVALKQNSTRRNLGLNEDKSRQKTRILLHGDFNSEDFYMYEKVTTPPYMLMAQSLRRLPRYYPSPYSINSGKIYFGQFGKKFPNKIGEFRYVYLKDENVLDIIHAFHQWKSEMDTLERAVLLSKTGKIHSSVFTPEDLINALKDAKEQLKETTAPFDLEPLNYDNTIDVSNVKISIVNGYLLYDIDVPMILPDNYRLYRLVPWPMKLNNQNAYFFVEPTEDFVAIKAHHHSYIPFTENELQSCKRFKEKIFCSVSSVLIDLDFLNTCEHSLISNNYKKNLLSVCTVKLIKLGKTVWYRLDNENSWIFTTSQDSINITCIEELGVNMTLNNCGWVKLNSTCIATSENVILKPFRKYVETNEVPELQIFRFNVADEVEEYLKNLKVELDDIVLYDFGKKGYLNLWELKLKGTSLDGIKIQTISRAKGNDHVWLWSFVILLTLLFVGYVLYQYVWKKKLWRKRVSQLREEYSKKECVSNGESIVRENNAVPMRTSANQNPNTEEHLISSW